MEVSGDAFALVTDRFRRPKKPCNFVFVCFSGDTSSAEVCLLLPASLREDFESSQPALAPIMVCGCCCSFDLLFSLAALDEDAPLGPLITHKLAYTLFL